MFLNHCSSIIGISLTGPEGELQLQIERAYTNRPRGENASPLPVYVCIDILPGKVKLFSSKWSTWDRGKWYFFPLFVCSDVTQVRRFEGPHHWSFDRSLLRMHRTYVSWFFSVSVSLFNSCLGGCPLICHLHIGSYPSPLPGVCCPHVGASIEEGQIVIGNGPWLVLRARPLACQLIGTTTNQSTAALPLIDGDWCQESLSLTGELCSQFTASILQVVYVFMYVFILNCSVHFRKNDWNVFTCIWMNAFEPYKH